MVKSCMLWFVGTTIEVELPAIRRVRRASPHEENPLMTPFLVFFFLLYFTHGILRATSNSDSNRGHTRAWASAILMSLGHFINIEKIVPVIASFLHPGRQVRGRRRSPPWTPPLFDILARDWLLLSQKNTRKNASQPHICKGKLAMTLTGFYWLKRTFFDNFVILLFGIFGFKLWGCFCSYPLVLLSIGFLRWRISQLEKEHDSQKNHHACRQKKCCLQQRKEQQQRNTERQGRRPGGSDFGKVVKIRV